MVLDRSTVDRRGHVRVAHLRKKKEGQEFPPAEAGPPSRTRERDLKLRRPSNPLHKKRVTHSGAQKNKTIKRYRFLRKKSGGVKEKAGSSVKERGTSRGRQTE